MLPPEIKSVYIAGPMRHIDQFNFPAFHSATANLRSRGIFVYSPAEHDEETGFDPLTDTLENFDLASAMKWDLQAVLSADAVVLLPGWEKSEGTAHELNVAMATETPIYTYPDLLPLRRDEQRVVNERTGGAKGMKLAQLGAVDPLSVMEVAKVAGFGCVKYDRYNFLKGYKWSLSFDALCRHLFAFWSGEDNDPESGLPHMAHVGWHSLTLLAFSRLHPDLDDRP